MIFEVSTEDLIAYGIDLEQYMLCMGLYTKSDDNMMRYYGTYGPLSRVKIEILIERKLVRSVSTSSLSYSNLRLNEELFLKLLGIETINSWIKEWFELWPQGVKSGGYYIRTDEKGCHVKLTRFTKKYPKYTKEIILEATRRYLSQRSLESYEYTKLAPNFIDQHGVSILAGECENVLNNIETQRPRIVQGDLFGSNEL